MEKIFLSLLLVVPALHAKSPDGCAAPTELIMQFLKKSGTLWRGSTDWKDSLDSMPTDKQIHTNYTATHLKEYLGFAARFMRLNETGVKTSFAITKKEGCIEVDSNVEYVEKRVVADEAGLQAVRESLKQHLHGEKRTFEEDNCTRCEYLANMKFDIKTQQLLVVLTAHCKSKIPNSLFK